MRRLGRIKAEINSSGSRSRAVRSRFSYRLSLFFEHGITCTRTRRTGVEEGILAK